MIISWYYIILAKLVVHGWGWKVVDVDLAKVVVHDHAKVVGHGWGWKVVDVDLAKVVVPDLAKVVVHGWGWHPTSLTLVRLPAHVLLQKYFVRTVRLIIVPSLWIIWINVSVFAVLWANILSSSMFCIWSCFVFVRILSLSLRRWDKDGLVGRLFCLCILSLSLRRWDKDGLVGRLVLLLGSRSGTRLPATTVMESQS